MKTHGKDKCSDGQGEGVLLIHVFCTYTDLLDLGLIYKGSEQGYVSFETD